MNDWIADYYKNEKARAAWQKELDAELAVEMRADLCPKGKNGAKRVNTAQQLAICGTTNLLLMISSLSKRCMKARNPVNMDSIVTGRILNIWHSIAILINFFKGLSPQSP